MTRPTKAIGEIKINLSECGIRGEIESLPGVEFDLEQLLTTGQRSVYFGVPSRVDIDCAQLLLPQID